MSRLLRSIIPYKDETFTSYLLRTCKANYYESLSWLTDIADIDIRQLAKPNPNKVNLKTLTKLLEIEEEKLWELTFFEDITYFSHLDDVSSFKDHANTEYDKICPTCFKNTSYIRKFWNLKINMACPIHSLLLINICPQCNKKISSIRKEINKCNCGASLYNLPKIFLNEDQVLHSKILYNAYFKKVFYKISDHSPINTLKYYSLTKLINSFWYRINHGRNGLGINQLNTQSKSLFEQLTSVYNLFIKWPNNFIEYLKKVTEPQTITNIKRDFYTKLYTEEFYVFREEFRKQIEEQTKKPVIFRKFNYVNHKSDLTSFTQVKKMLSMSKNSVNNLIENGLLIEINTHESNSRSITTESLNNFIKLKDYIVFKKDLANLLGLTGKQINLFEESGWVKRIEYFSKRNDKKSYYDIRFGEELIYNIEKNNVVPITEDLVKSNKLITFEIFHNRAAVKGISFLEVVEELIKGTITIYKVENKIVFKSYYFNLDEILTFIKIKRFEKFFNKGIRINSQELCYLLKVSGPNITSWTQFGFLEITNPTQTYSYATVEAFMDNYIPVTYLINEYKTSVPSLFIKLKNMGIFPISGPSVNGGFGYLYRKSDLAKLQLNLPEMSLKSRITEIIQTSSINV